MRGKVHPFSWDIYRLFAYLEVLNLWQKKTIFDRFGVQIVNILNSYNEITVHIAFALNLGQ